MSDTELTPEEIELLLSEAKKYAKPPKIFSKCKNCEFGFTESQHLEWNRCPVCGHDVAEIIEEDEVDE